MYPTQAPFNSPNYVTSNTPPMYGGMSLGPRSPVGVGPGGMSQGGMSPVGMGPFQYPPGYWSGPHYAPEPMPQVHYYPYVSPPPVARGARVDGEDTPTPTRSARRVRTETKERS